MSTISFTMLIFALLLIIPHSNAAKPNFVFILVDDLGFGDVNFNRATADNEINTPNMDRLATTEGLHLMRHYVHFTVKSIYIHALLHI